MSSLPVTPSPAACLPPHRLGAITSSGANEALICSPVKKNHRANNFGDRGGRSRKVHLQPHLIPDLPPPHPLLFHSSVYQDFSETVIRTNRTIIAHWEAMATRLILGVAGLMFVKGLVGWLIK